MSSSSAPMKLVASFLEPSLIAFMLIHCFMLLPSPAAGTRRMEAPHPPCSDYEMLVVNTKQCVRRCSIRCVNGVCFETDVCPCEGFYRTSFKVDEEGLICAADCLPGCKSAGGYCAAPDLCLCRKKGFYFNSVARRCWKQTIFHDRCRGQCSYGKCNANGECVCAQGYAYQNAILGQLCRPVCEQNCGPHGYCHLPGMCACRKKHHHYEADGMCHKDPTYL